MNKMRIYIINGFFSMLIGIAVEVVYALVKNQNTIMLHGLIESMLMGIVIGTSSLFSLFHVFARLKNTPAAGFAVNFIVVALFLLIPALYYGITHTFSEIPSKWFVSLAVAECLSFILTFIWYRQIKLYNDKLALKKASLENWEDKEI